MRAPLKRRMLFALVPAVIAAGVWFFLSHRQPPDIRAYRSLRQDWEAAADTNEKAKNELAGRSLEVSRTHPDSVGALNALLLASIRAPDTAAGREAQRQLAQQIDGADIGLLAEVLHGRSDVPKDLHRLAPAMVMRVRREPGHPEAARLLAAVCTITNPRTDGEPPPAYVEAADLIADRYAGSPNVFHFCEGLGAIGTPPWADRFERHLRTILEHSQDRWVRCTALFALAAALQSSAEDRQAEAETLFERFCAEYDGKFDYSYQGVERELYRQAKDHLTELRQRAVGKPAPEITGLDLDGRPMTLSEYRGRVVLLNFWGTWCFPCMKLVPHERELVAHYRGQPFEIVGLNCDDDPEKARTAAAKAQMTWRSFRHRGGDGKPVTAGWRTFGLPTVYLVDHHGIIRRRWVGSPPPDELTHMTEVLIDAARQKVPPGEMQPVTAALRLRSPAIQEPPAGPREAPVSESRARFVDNAFRDADGSESKYVVFVPASYDAAIPCPAILFLHGAGARGSDGRRPLKGGLAQAIRDKGDGFPFIVVFPQAREGENWTAKSAGGQRALAIMDQVQKDYRFDADRVSLTGLSMGGEGTWSLAAAEPGRWAAIVPICHGGDTKTVAQLKKIPCWCFHGDADKVIPVQRSREMVQAIAEAGGRPLYQELSGIDHDACAPRVYSMPDLYEWLLLQNRTKR